MGISARQQSAMETGSLHQCVVGAALDDPTAVEPVDLGRRRGRW